MSKSTLAEESKKKKKQELRKKREKELQKKMEKELLLDIWFYGKVPEQSWP